MAKSQNGWPVSPARTERTVPGTNVKLTVADGPAGDVLMYVAEQFHKRVESLTDMVDDWGYANRVISGSTQLSNHASATAIDLNATKHGLGKSGTFTKAKVAKIREILSEVGGVIRWGGDYTGRKDEMHFEINSPYAAVADVAKRLNTPPADSVGQPTVKLGSTGDGVRLVQRYLGIPDDGAFGPITEQKVIAYQRSQELEADGIVGPATWARIYSGLGNSGDGPGGNSPVSGATLKKGDTGQEVRELQALLNRDYPLYSKLRVDGDFGTATEAVVKEFQRRSGLTADGIVGPATRAALKF